MVWLQVWCWAAPGFTINNPSWVITTLHISNKPSASFGHVRHIFFCTLQGWLPQQTRLSAVLERYWTISLAQHHTLLAGPKREVHYRASRARNKAETSGHSVSFSCSAPKTIVASRAFPAGPLHTSTSACQHASLQYIGPPTKLLAWNVTRASKSHPWNTKGESPKTLYMAQKFIKKVWCPCMPVDPLVTY